MNRKDFQKIAIVRFREAQILFRANEFSGAYYLAGYAVECALKACIAKQVKRHDFPDKESAKAYTHNLKALALLANIESSRLIVARSDEIFRKNWDLITLWSEESRYRTSNKQECKAFLDAIMEEHHGLMPWIKRLW